MRLKTTYWIAGLPVALRYRRAKPRAPLEGLRHFYAQRYWSDEEAVRKVRRRALSALLPRLFLDLVHYTRLNGAIVRSRHGVSIARQVAGQILAYLRHGILPRWYYIFSLYEARSGRPEHFLNRFETKAVLFPFLNRNGSSPLGDKVAFARYCEAHALPHVPILAVADQGRLELADPTLPSELFVKPIRSRGGQGAERWIRSGGGDYAGPGGVQLTPNAFLARLETESGETPRLVQPRAVNHSAIADLSNGALTTVRVLSCLDEDGGAEIVAASFRMAVGANNTVDNIHAGGIAAPVDLETGVLGPASNLGDNAALGWLSRHPDTNAPIEGRTLPFWQEVRALVERAHVAFGDRTVIGWDVGLLESGPTLVEGNGGPDVDLMQRPLRHGIGGGRFADLLWHHLRKRLEAAG